MFSLTSSHRYYLYQEPVDMRKSFDGLSGLIAQRSKNPLNGEVFVFINKKRDRVKLLHWEAGGFVLYYKRLEKGTLGTPNFEAIKHYISWSDLMLIIEGIEIKKMVKKPRF